MLRTFGRRRRDNQSDTSSRTNAAASKYVTAATDSPDDDAIEMDEKKKKRSVWSMCHNPRQPPEASPTSAMAILEPSPPKAIKRRRGPRFSLRRLFYGSPLVAQPLYHSPSGTPGPSVSSRQTKKSREHHADVAGDAQSLDTKSAVWRDNMSSCSSLQGAAALSVGGASVLGGGGAGGGIRECPLCLHECGLEMYPLLKNCPHLFCLNCLQTYVRIEIQEGRVNLKCPQCSEAMHPNDIESLIGDKNSNLLTLYESLMLRRLLSIDPDTRWCPGPNCTYAVIAAGCASCPKITCERHGCGYSFCYHCKAEWHPNQTCDAARAQRNFASSAMPLSLRSHSATFSFESAAAAATNVVTGSGAAGGGSLSVGSQLTSEVKVCPRCNTLIVKMDDGSCNHMTCAVCGTEFCWLCMKEISDLHYLSPSGCTFWGKKPWSRKKKLFWQLGTLVGAPVGIALLAGIAVPAMIIGIPCWVGKKIHNSLKESNRHKRNLAIAGGVVSSMVVSPLLAGLAVSIGVPILLCYVYGIVPIALCRSEGCGVYTSVSGVRIDVDEKEEFTGHNSASTLMHRTDANASGNLNVDASSFRRAQSVGAGDIGSSIATAEPRCLRSLIANPSIGEVSLGASLSMGSGCRLERDADVASREEADREDASNIAMAGASIAGSLASSSRVEASKNLGIGNYHIQHRLEVGADIHTRKKLSFSGERLSETVSLFGRSATISLADDGAGSAASTRGLAGSILAYKMGDSQSVGSYKLAGISADGGETVSNVVAAATGESDEISFWSLPLKQQPTTTPGEVPRSLSPVGSITDETGSNLPDSSKSRPSSSLGSKRFSRRQRLDKQMSDNGSGGFEDSTSERVRFDDNVSFIDAEEHSLGYISKEDLVTVTPVVSSVVSVISSQSDLSEHLGNRGYAPTDHVTLLSVGNDETANDHQSLTKVSEEI